MTVRAFASAALFGLVLEGLTRQGLAPPVPAGPALGHRLGDAALPHARKRDLLAAILSAHGPVALLRIGEAVPEAGFHPLLHTLLRASDGADLLLRWQNLERYAHSHHRTLLDRRGPRAWQVRHVALGAVPPPQAAEDLLILGMQVGLLAAIGCTGIVAATACGRPLLDRGWQDRSVRAAIAQGASERWLLSWDADPQRPAATAPAPLRLAKAPPAERLAALIAADPARGWALATAGAALGLSARTLQRRLREAGLNFIAVQRAVRLRAACDALSLPEPPPLPAIGFACGFSDQSHFTREFARRTGVPPGRYRALLQGQAGRG
jgi:AraC-like DNA-binding protein